MENKNKYIKFNLPENIIGEIYELGQLIKKDNEQFSPFEYNDIHMTVCYLGNLSKNLGSVNKKEKYIEIDELINNFNNNHINELTFKGFELFGDKKNLLVAIFDIPKNECNRIINFKKQFVKYGAPQEEYYTPHITIGKLMYNSKIDIHQLKTYNITNNILNNLSVILH